MSELNVAPRAKQDTPEKQTTNKNVFLVSFLYFHFQ